MSALHHKPFDHSPDTCAYCLEPWPCVIGKARIEIAQAIRAQAPGGQSEYSDGMDAGMDLAANIAEGI